MWLSCPGTPNLPDEPAPSARPPVFRLAKQEPEHSSRSVEGNILSDYVHLVL